MDTIGIMIISLIVVVLLLLVNCAIKSKAPEKDKANIDTEKGKTFELSHNEGTKVMPIYGSTLKEQPSSSEQTGMAAQPVFANPVGPLLVDQKTFDQMLEKSGTTNKSNATLKSLPFSAQKSIADSQLTKSFVPLESGPKSDFKQ